MLGIDHRPILPAVGVEFLADFKDSRRTERSAREGLKDRVAMERPEVELRTVRLVQELLELTISPVFLGIRGRILGIIDARVFEAGGADLDVWMPRLDLVVDHIAHLQELGGRVRPKILRGVLLLDEPDIRARLVRVQEGNDEARVVVHLLDGHVRIPRVAGEHRDHAPAVGLEDLHGLVDVGRNRQAVHYSNPKFDVLDTKSVDGSDGFLNERGQTGRVEGSIHTIPLADLTFRSPYEFGVFEITVSVAD